MNVRSILAVKYVRDQAHLDAVRKGQRAPDTIQFAMNQIAARKVGEALIAVANQMDADAPPKDKQN